MKQTIKFSKMQGLGNDFVVIHAVDPLISLKNLPIPMWSHRHLGIGFDQLLFIDKSQLADFSCRIFNSDGREAEQCGNGMRCVAYFIYEKKLCEKNTFTIETLGGIVTACVKNNTHITIDMGIPCFEKECTIQLSPSEPLLNLSLLSLGNPHAILPVESTELAPVVELGLKISTHTLFPNGVNVGFMQVINRKKIKLRTFERGAGETFACGTNSCAAVVAGIEKGWLDNKVEVELALGSLWIEWAGKGYPLRMSGPAEWVFEGTITL